MSPIIPEQSLPLPPGFTNENDYVDELLAYATSNDMLQLLAGGIHVLDFFTRDPDFYEWVLPGSWRQWFGDVDLLDIMDFVLRDDLELIVNDATQTWRNRTRPPQDLLDYVWSIRRLLLRRTPLRPAPINSMPYHVSVGMRAKKIQEVGSFSQYIDHLARGIEHRNGRPISHLIDFGAGQNYLGRALAHTPINRNVVAVESRAENIEVAQRMDTPATKHVTKMNATRLPDVNRVIAQPLPSPIRTEKIQRQHDPTGSHESTKMPETGTIQYITQHLDSGDLARVITQVKATRTAEQGIQKSSDRETSGLNLMVLSLHSCGNLSHHGLRSLIANPEVSVVAIVGCCYNLATERLTKPSKDINHTLPLGRLHETAGDPLGFPMSNKLFTYPVRPNKKGLHLNITTRMMAVQAPTNWTPPDCKDFITRHFYRSLLQKVLLDHKIISKPALQDPYYHGYVAGESRIEYNSASGGLSSGPAIVVGKLGKSAFTSFVAYTRTALSRMAKSGEQKHLFQQLDDDITDDELRRYEEDFGPRWKEMGILWTLMAYSAGLAEAIIVIDRWQWLREQDDVAECWVEPVFDYTHSPRNLVVVGIKK